MQLASPPGSATAAPAAPTSAGQTELARQPLLSQGKKRWGGFAFRGFSLATGEGAEREGERERELEGRERKRGERVKEERETRREGERRGREGGRGSQSLLTAKDRAAAPPPLRGATRPPLGCWENRRSRGSATKCREANEQHPQIGVEAPNWFSGWEGLC